jgi:hypothetical protein
MRYTNTSTKIRSIAIILCFVTVAYSMSSSCYAITKTVPIELKCSKDWNLDEISRHYYPGDEKIKYSLTTIGMKTAATEDELITNWYEKPREYATVYAACQGMTIPLDMVPTNHLPSIMCQRGQSLTVSFNYPININPDAYKYYGILTIDSEEEDGENRNTEGAVIKQNKDQLEEFSGNQILSDNSTTDSRDASLLGGYNKLISYCKTIVANVVYFSAN